MNFEDLAAGNIQTDITWDRYTAPFPENRSLNVRVIQRLVLLVQVKLILQQAMKGQRRSRGIALLLL
jgi:hypothetical protein